MLFVFLRPTPALFSIMLLPGAKTRYRSRFLHTMSSSPDKLTYFRPKPKQSCYMMLPPLPPRGDIFRSVFRTHCLSRCGTPSTIIMLYQRTGVCYITSGVIFGGSEAPRNGWSRSIPISCSTPDFTKCRGQIIQGRSRHVFRIYITTPTQELDASNSLATDPTIRISTAFGDILIDVMIGVVRAASLHVRLRR